MKWEPYAWGTKDGRFSVNIWDDEVLAKEFFEKGSPKCYTADSLEEAYKWCEDRAQAVLEWVACGWRTSLGRVKSCLWRSKDRGVWWEVDIFPPGEEGEGYCWVVENKAPDFDTAKKCAERIICEAADFVRSVEEVCKDVTRGEKDAGS